MSAINNNQITLKEHVDPRVVAYLITEFDNLGMIFDEEYTRSAQLTILRNYLRKIENNPNKPNDGIVTTTYQPFQLGARDGRLQGKNCWQGMKKELRHTMASPNYYDIDIKNAHPVMLSFWCSQNQVTCINLNAFIEDRERYMKAIMDSLKLDRASAKDFLLKIINDGGKATVKKCADFAIKNLNDELKLIRAAIMRKHPELKKRSEKKVHEKTKKLKKNECDKYSVEGSCVSAVMCKYENLCLMAMYEFSISKGIEVGTLVFDGLMVKKQDNYQILDLLTPLEDYVKAKTGIKVCIVEKPMTEGFKIPDLTQMVLRSASLHYSFIGEILKNVRSSSNGRRIQQLKSIVVMVYFLLDVLRKNQRITLTLGTDLLHHIMIILKEIN